MLAILTTHPIQYQTPIWRALAAHGAVPFTVYYMSDQGLKPRLDHGFGRDLAWDIELLVGYPHEFLAVETGADQRSFGWLRLKPGFGRMLKDRGVRVLWVQGWQVMAYWQAIRAARRAGIAVWIRGETNLRSNAGGLPRWLKWTILKRLLNRVDRFLTVGVANRQFYLRLGYREAQMFPAPYCVENRRFSDQAASAQTLRNQIRSDWGLPEDAFCFLFVGKFVPKKRPFDLIEGVRRLQLTMSRRTLHILWAGTGELGTSLRAASTVRHDADADLPVEVVGGDKPAGSFAGFLNQSEIARAYVAADALVLPSDAKETWGLVVNEAMAAGLPCVVSAACGCAEDLVQPLRPDLCFPVGDIDGLVRALAAVVADPPPAQLLQEHIDKYDPARTVESVVTLYQPFLQPAPA